MDYLNFEKRMTNELTVMFRRAEDPVTKEMARLQTLRTREWCRDYWVAMNREVPVRIRFSKEGGMNKHIEVVKKWLADNDSVSHRELESNRVTAYCVAVRAATGRFTGRDPRIGSDAAVMAAELLDDARVALSAAEAAASASAAEAAFWVKRYEKLTNE